MTTTAGGATGERSSYGPLAKLLDAVGATLKPKVPRDHTNSAARKGRRVLPLTRSLQIGPRRPSGRWTA